MGAAAGLDHGDLLGVLDVGDVEDADATGAIRTGDLRGRRTRGPGRGRSGGTGGSGEWLDAAVGAAAAFDGHEEQVAVDGDVTLTAGADQRGDERELGWVGGVVEVDAPEVSDEEMVSAERHIGVGVVECASVTAVGVGLGWGVECSGLAEGDDLLHAEDGLGRVGFAALESDARIVGGCARIDVDAGGRNVGGNNLLLALGGAERGKCDCQCKCGGEHTARQRSRESCHHVSP